jgi:hypothetical protein
MIGEKQGVLDKMDKHAKIEVPVEFYNQLNMMCKEDLIGIIINLTWELQKIHNAEKENKIVIAH